MKLEGLSRKHNGAFKFMKKMDHRIPIFDLSTLLMLIL